MLNVDVLSVFMLSVTRVCVCVLSKHRYAQCRLAECSYAECPGVHFITSADYSSKSFTVLVRVVLNWEFNPC
jgi:hypothetical protein